MPPWVHVALAPVWPVFAELSRGRKQPDASRGQWVYYLWAASRVVEPWHCPEGFWGTALPQPSPVCSPVSVDAWCGAPESPLVSVQAFLGMPVAVSTCTVVGHIAQPCGAEQL